MKVLLNRLYVVGGELNPHELVDAICRQGTIDLSVQKYVAVGDGAFRKAWTEPAQCTLRPCSFGNDLVRSEEGELVNVSARVINVSTTRSEPEMDGSASAKELLGLSLNFYYDCEHEVGLIIDGYNGNSRRAAITRTRLDVALNDDELVQQEIMRQMGIPEELWGSLQLLREMSGD